MTRSKAQDWQKDPKSINSNRVQVWSDKGTMIGVKNKAWAVENITNKTVFVISDQAVGYYG